MRAMRGEPGDDNHAADRSRCGTYTSRRAALWIVLVYIGAAGLWILTSDQLIARLAADAEQLTRLQTWKGWFFIAVTGALLYGLILATLARARALQAALDQSRRRWQLLFASVGDAVFIAELRPDGGGRFLEVNDVAVSRLGWSRAELLARSPAEIIAGDAAAWAQALLREGSTLAEQEHRRRDGALVPVEVHARLVELDGRQAVLAVARDVTERRQAAERMIHAERMAAVGILAGGLAHEYNNLHTVLLGQLEFALMDGGLTPALRHRLEVMASTVHRAAALTSNLLAFSRTSASARSGAQLDAVARETLAMLEHQLASDGVTVVAELAPVPEVAMDPAQIGQVAMNLLLNAWHALRGREQRRITVTTGSADDRVWLRVADTGIGIPRAAQADIFLPFFTTKGAMAAAGTPQSQVRGTGLGLSVSRSIANAHGGDLTVASEPDAGATFTLWLPRAAAPAAPAACTGEARPGARVLVLDDDELIAALVVEQLEALGHRAVATDDGAEALAMHRGERFALALVDLQMPKMSGAEFLERLRAADPQPPPAVIMTGRLTEEQLSPAVRAMAVEVLRKPFALAALREAVGRALAGPGGAASRVQGPGSGVSI